MVHEIRDKSILEVIRNSAKEIGGKTLGAYALMGILLVTITATFILAQKRQTIVQNASYNEATRTFTETFDGAPTTPQPFTQLMQNSWDIAIQSRNTDTWDTLVPLEAHHGPDCSPPIDASGNLVTHHMDGNYDNAVFKCKDHIMTSIYGIGNSVHDGYGAIYLTPNAMVDFTDSEATIRFEMSTLRTSARDWVDVWVTPYEENLQMPFDVGVVDLQGNPKEAITLRMIAPNDNNKSGFAPSIFSNFANTNEFPSFSNSYNWYTGLEDLMKTSPKQRTMFELKISKTHLRFCIPSGQVDELGNPINGGKEFCWLDKTINPLSFSKGIVQFGHHSYTPDKDCSFSTNLICKPDTWHWNNISISPAIPFTMIKADRRFTDGTNDVVFNSPAPTGSFLRFAGIGKIQVSYDDGITFTPINPQPASDLTHVDHFASYFTPIPLGATKVKFKFSANDWYSGPFRAKDFAIWSQTVTGSSSSPTPTTNVPTNTPIPTPTITIVSTPTLTPTPTPIPTATPTPTKTPSPTPLPTATPTSTPTPSPTPIPQKTGDANDDNKVDIQDLSFLLTHWNKSDAPTADFNHDGIVNITDLSSLLSNWGK